MLTLTADRKVTPGELDVHGVDWQGVFIGPDPIGLGGFEVAVAVSDHAVSPAEIRHLHKLRLDGRDTHLVVAVVFGENASLFGPDPKLRPQVQSLSSAERKLQAALNEPDTSQAMRRFLALSDSESSGQMAGVRNRGLFASYHLRENVSKRPDWTEMMDLSEKLLDSRGRQLVEDLGFTIAEQANDALVLADASDEGRAVAILLDDSEYFDQESPRFHASPVAWGLGLASEKGLPWLIMLRHEQIRLYPAKDRVGVGQKGQTETYLELDLAGIAPAYYGLLSLIFSASALAQNGTAQQLLEESNRYATELGVRLRDRIYSDVVPDLARAVANQMQSSGHELNSKGLQDAYRTTLRILFRILFQAYAEDRGLLPLERNPHFHEKSLTAVAKAFLEGDISYGEGTGLWDTLQDVWTAIDEGNPEWSVPAYNGGLFGSDPERRPYGALIKNISLPDSVVGPALSKLLVDQSGDGVLGMIDFRSLSVREFGTIYEGLLESSLSLADTDLTLDANGVWLPAHDGDTVEAKAGQPYFHNTSGERKATGSYFTPDFIVDHLIERSIDPTLDAHLERISALLQEGKHPEAAKNFFDYRVADIAMGSAHFLVAAVDRIESKMRTFLATPENTIPGVKNELERLAEAARVALGSDLVAIDDIDEAVLLRRQIARRCIYGIDINPLAVELARLAIWIHTFVPGLPMSTLDHNLVCANSLVGISNLDELTQNLFRQANSGELDLQSHLVEDTLGIAAEAISDATAVGEATVAEVELSRESRERAGVAVEGIRPLFDLGVAIITGVIKKTEVFDLEELLSIANSDSVRGWISQVNPAHFPLLFPEVFSRPAKGFDVLLGNPPWEELVVDSTAFWASKSPGLRAKKVQERERLIDGLKLKRPDAQTELEIRIANLEKLRRVLLNKYPIGKGDFDLFKAFAWQALNVASTSSGAIGFVLPKTAFTAAGLENWRRKVQELGSIKELLIIGNDRRWAFDMEPRYSIGLVSVSLGDEDNCDIRATASSLEEFNTLRNSDPVVISRESLLNFTKSASIPIVRRQMDADIMAQMRKQPGLDEVLGGRVRAVRELDATNDRKYFDHGEGDGHIPVLTGASFNVWTPDTGTVFAWADPKIAIPHLVAKFHNQQKLKKSAFYGLDLDEDLGGNFPWELPRIALRGVTRPTDSRTLIPALVPPNSLLVNMAPYLFVPKKSSAEEAFLLGVMSSILFDWYSRRFIEVGTNFHLLYAFPLPDLASNAIHDRIVSLSGALVNADNPYFGWKEDLRLENRIPQKEQGREDSIAELDALVALAYGLDQEQLVHVFETFHRGWDYQPRLEKVLDFFRQWEDKA